MLAIIRATQQATELIAKLELEHGPLSFHFTGRIGGSLCCLPEGELRIGSSDVLMGYVGGAPLYMRRDDAALWGYGDMVVATTHGHTRGFSLEGGHGMRFVLRAATLVTSDAGAGSA